MDFKKTDSVEYCYIVYWEDDHSEKVCVDSQPLDQTFPDAELIPIARVMSSVGEQLLLVAIRGCSPLLLRVFSEDRRDPASSSLINGLRAMCSCSVSGKRTKMCLAWWS